MIHYYSSKPTINKNLAFLFMHQLSGGGETKSENCAPTPQVFYIAKYTQLATRSNNPQDFRVKQQTWYMNDPNPSICFVSWSRMRKKNLKSFKKIIFHCFGGNSVLAKEKVFNSLDVLTHAVHFAYFTAEMKITIFCLCYISLKHLLSTFRLITLYIDFFQA